MAVDGAIVFENQRPWTVLSKRPLVIPCATLVSRNRLQAASKGEGDFVLKGANLQYA